MAYNDNSQLKNHYQLIANIPFFHDRFKLVQFFNDFVEMADVLDYKPTQLTSTKSVRRSLLPHLDIRPVISTCPDCQRLGIMPNAKIKTAQAVFSYLGDLITS